MLIVAAGMMRSASTWQYQVAFELASLAGPATFLGYLERDEFTNEFDRITAEDGIFVVKMHPHHELVADIAQKGRAKILYTFRDIRDVLFFDGSQIHDVTSPSNPLVSSRRYGSPPILDELHKPLCYALRGLRGRQPRGTKPDRRVSRRNSCPRLPCRIGSSI